MSNWDSLDDDKKEIQWDEMFILARVFLRNTSIGQRPEEIHRVITKAVAFDKLIGWRDTIYIKGATTQHENNENNF